MHTVEFINVTKKYKDFAIKNLNFTIPKGYITGFVGPNGSGKTTTIQMMMNILQIDQGDIKLFGTNYQDHNLKQRIGFVYDDLYIYEEFNIKKMKSFIAPLYNTWNEKLFQTYLDVFELPFRKKIKHFSKGMKMKCSLLFALSHEPEFIVMDEPTAELDPIFRRELLDILQELMIREHQTIFFSTHITTDLDQIADHIIFIDNGQIILEQSMENLREQFHMIKGNTNMLDADTRALFTGIQETKIGFRALFEGDPSLFDEFEEELMIVPATLDDMMYFLTRKER